MPHPAHCTRRETTATPHEALIRCRFAGCTAAVTRSSHQRSILTQRERQFRAMKPARLRTRVRPLWTVMFVGLRHATPTPQSRRGSVLGRVSQVFGNPSKDSHSRRAVRSFPVAYGLPHKHRHDRSLARLGPGVATRFSRKAAHPRRNTNVRRMPPPRRSGTEPKTTVACGTRAERCCESVKLHVSPEICGWP
jgi:hypothetical protein